MKVLVSCVALVALVAAIQGRRTGPHPHGGKHMHERAKKFTYEQFEKQLCDMKKEADAWIDTVLDEEGALNEECQAMLDSIEQSVCFDPDTYTDTCAEDGYFGCGCMDAFSTQPGECSQVPCRIVQYVKSNLVDVLVTYRYEVDSVESFARLVLEKLYTPFMEMACPCFPGLTDATFQCIENYDALVIKPYESIYQAAVVLFDLDTLKDITDTIMSGYCAEVGGVQCHEEFGGMMLTYARMFDNTFNEEHEDQCTSWQRTERGTAQFLQMAVVSSRERVMKGAKRLLHTALCDAQCQEVMADSFYSCCAKHGYQILQEREYSEKLAILVENINNMMVMADLGGEGGKHNYDWSIMSQVQGKFNPEVECSKKGEVNYYAEMGAQCEL